VASWRGATEWLKRNNRGSSHTNTLSTTPSRWATSPLFGEELCRGLVARSYAEGLWRGAMQGACGEELCRGLLNGLWHWTDDRVLDRLIPCIAARQRVASWRVATEWLKRNYRGDSHTKSYIWLDGISCIINHYCCQPLRPVGPPRHSLARSYAEGLWRGAMQRACGYYSMQGLVDILLVDRHLFLPMETREVRRIVSNGITALWIASLVPSAMHTRCHLCDKQSDSLYVSLH